MTSLVLANNQTSTGIGTEGNKKVPQPGVTYKSFQSFGKTSSGVGAATIAIEASNNGIDWISLGNINLTLGTTSTTNSLTYQYPWLFYRANVSALSGTGASVGVTMAY